MDKNEKTVETTVFDYLRWRGDLTFAQDAFNEVDNLILCIIAYLNFRRFPELTAREPEKAVLLGDIFPRMTAEDEQQGLSPNDYIPLMRLAAESRRFGGVRMLGYEAVRDRRRCSWTRCPSWCPTARCSAPLWAPTGRWWGGRRT